MNSKVTSDSDLEFELLELNYLSCHSSPDSTYGLLNFGTPNLTHPLPPIAPLSYIDFVSSTEVKMKGDNSARNRRR